MDLRTERQTRTPGLTTHGLPDFKAREPRTEDTMTRKAGTSAFEERLVEVTIRLIKKVIEGYFVWKMNTTENWDRKYMLDTAIELDLLGIVRYLVNKVDLNVRDLNGETPLIKAVRFGNKEIVKALLEDWSIDLDLRDKEAMTALMHAVQNKNLELVKLLVESGANTEIIDNEGDTCLGYAVNTGNLEMVQFLIYNGANTSIRNFEGLTILMSDILEPGIPGSLEVFKFLVDWGVDINRKDCGGRDVFMHAAYSGNLEIVRFLIDMGANTGTELNKLTALDFGIMGSKPQIVRLLVENGAEINEKYDIANTGTCTTPLFLAVRFSNPEMIETLLELGADAKTENAYGMTAYNYAVLLEKTENAERLRFLGGRRTSEIKMFNDERKKLERERLKYEREILEAERKKLERLFTPHG